MEASRVSFFKQTKEKMNSELSKKEKGRLRLEMFMKNCPDSGVEVQEAIKYAGFDPTIKKELKKGYNFIYNNKKLGNIKEIPVNEFFDGSSKKIKTLYAPNYGKVKVTKKSDEENQEKVSKAIKRFNDLNPKVDSVDIKVKFKDSEYSFNLANIDKLELHRQFEKLLEIIKWQTIYKV